MLPDLQNSEDRRGIPINRVGIQNVDFPMTVITKDGQHVNTQAKVSLFVSLPSEYKGANMSRFSEVLIDHQDKYMSPEAVFEMATSLKERMKSQDAWIRFEFNYFMDKAAPVSGKSLKQAHKVAFSHAVRDLTDTPMIEVSVIGASVCPCSKEMSLRQMVDSTKDLTVPIKQIKVGNLAFEMTPPVLQSALFGLGAHNQRCTVRVQVIPKENTFIYFEDLIELIDKEFSVPVYPILKRPDEQFVTITGYLNPKFVEDIARDVAIALNKVDTIDKYHISVTSEESIHPHDCKSIIHSPNWKQYE